MKSFIKSASFIVVVMLLSVCIGYEKAYSWDKGCFYRDFLMQQMMINQIREFRGGVASKALSKRLAKKAEGLEEKSPGWAGRSSGKNTFKYNRRIDSKVDPKRYDFIILKASKIYNLPPALIKAVIHAESAFVADAVSRKGAMGLMQLMPETAREINVSNTFNPRANVYGGSFLLRKYLDQFRSLKKTLIAYNAGPRWVGKNRIPSETRTYIRRVISYYRLYSRKEIRES